MIHWSFRGCFCKLYIIPIVVNGMVCYVILCQQFIVKYNVAVAPYVLLQSVLYFNPDSKNVLKKKLVLANGIAASSTLARRR